MAHSASTKIVGARVAAGLYDKIEAQARSVGLNVSDVLRALLEREFLGVDDAVIALAGKDELQGIILRFLALAMEQLSRDQLLDALDLLYQQQLETRDGAAKQGG